MANARVRRFQSLWRFNPRHRAYERNTINEMKLLVTRIGDDPIPSGSKPDVLPTQTHGYYRGDFPSLYISLYYFTLRLSILFQYIFLF